MEFFSFQSWTSSWFFWPVLIWTIIWKGIALWKAARLREKWWFIAILIINTIGLLEIVYIFAFAKEKGLKNLMD